MTHEAIRKALDMAHKADRANVIVFYSFLAALLADRDRLAAEVASIHGKLDAMLKHCPDSECYTCSAIICPHGDAMHFHHDGCPTCAAIDTASPEEGTS